MCDVLAFCSATLKKFLYQVLRQSSLFKKKNKNTLLL